MPAHSGRRGHQSRPSNGRTGQTERSPARIDREPNPGGTHQGERSRSGGPAWGRPCPVAGNGSSGGQPGRAAPRRPPRRARRPVPGAGSPGLQGERLGADPHRRRRPVPGSGTGPRHSRSV